MTFETNTAEKWPNFFIVGAPRAATTSLYHYLKAVPGIYMSPVKEPHYFAVTLKAFLNTRAAKPAATRLIHERGEYLKLFQDVKDEIAVGEASPSYLWDPAAPGLIHEVVPQARIIISLRDPVERAFSHYLMHVRDGVERLPFQEVVEAPAYIVPGLYAAQVKRYLDVFGADHVKILVFEEFTRNVEEAVNDILKFLGVNGWVSRRMKIAHNAFGVPRGNLVKRIVVNRGVRLVARSLIPSGIRRVIREKILYKKTDKPKIPDVAGKFLAEIYREDVKALEEVLGRSLPWTLSGK